MSDPEAHITEWVTAGLIDPPTAERLRQAIRGATTVGSPPDPGAGTTISAGPVPTAAGSLFGPAVAIGEMFGYLGAAFLLGAWLAFLTRLSASTDREAILSGGLTLTALVMFALGLFLARGDARQRRGAGIAFVAVTALAAGAVGFLVQLDFLRNTLEGEAPAILIVVVVAAVAIGLRRVLPAVATQLVLLLALTGLAGEILVWLRDLAFPNLDGDYATFPSSATAEPVALALAAGVWWLLVALGMGLLGLVEARGAGADRAAFRRANITRFWAGLVAVIGLASALAESGSLGGGRYGRMLEPWIADLAILVLAAVLVERAFRRGADAFILSAALGLVIALTDFNFSYLTESTEVGLVIEGAILLVVGFAVDRLRRRLDRSHDGWPVRVVNPGVPPG